MTRGVVVVAAHKPYRMPEDDLYLPLQVGRAGKEPIPGWTGDDTGENISEKNDRWCELTGLYWAWKHLDGAFLGLAHYRRHFASPTAHGGRWERILTREQAERALAGTPVLLPKKRRYWIESGCSQYVHAHHEADLTVTRAILTERHPECTEAFDRTLGRTSGHRFNLFVMKREYAERYCAWLFDVLFELERRLDISSYSANDRRVFGFVAERLLDVWIEAYQIPYKELPWVYLEKQNWFKKGGAFLLRKLRGHKRRSD